MYLLGGLRMKKIIFAVLVAVIIIFAAVPALADDFPPEIWPVLDQYNAAGEAGDDSAYLYWGEQAVQIMEAQPDSHTKREFLAGRYEQLSRCAERLGLYDKAVLFYRKYIPLGEYMGWNDGVIQARDKVIVLQRRLDVFVEDADYYPPYYGAKFEPQRGAYFGSVYDMDPRILDFNTQKIQQVYPKKNSVYLMYVEFGEEIEATPRFPRYLQDAKANGVGVELAWNIASSLPNIVEYDDYIRRSIDYLDSLGIPIFLRFGAEMNISAGGDDPASFVRAFQYVASIAKTKQNIATVWSPADLGAIDRPFERYYPGDEYVDWVGVSLYPLRYFQGLRDHGASTDVLNTYFMSDYFANPVSRLTPLIQFMDQYRIQKPIMVSECGAPHYVRTENEDVTGWGIAQMRRIYGEVMRTFPQVKLLCYFNVSMENEPHDYALYKSDALFGAYNDAVADSYFLSDIGSVAPYGFLPFQGGEYYRDETLSLSASAYYPKEVYGSVRYYLDGGLVGEVSGAPYRFALPLHMTNPGEHRIAVQYCSGDNVLFERSFGITVREDIKVYLDGEQVMFQGQRPVIVNDRTLVPVRGVFEQMGMRVEWIEEEQKVVLRSAERTISLKLNSDALIVERVGESETYTMDVPAQLIGERTMVPLRAIAQAAGARVEWDDTVLSVLITTR